MTRPISPYLTDGFYADALARGRHRDIIGGRWDETGLIQMRLLIAEGLLPRHRLLDIGCGPLRTGCRLVSYLNPGHYWGTDLSHDLMIEGWHRELTESGRARLPQTQLIADDGFAFPGLPDHFDVLFCFAVFTHLPIGHLDQGLTGITSRFGQFEKLLFTVFLAPDPAFDAPFRQVDGVVTHPDRTPYHFRESDVMRLCAKAGLRAERRDLRLPRGQVLFAATRAD